MTEEEIRGTINALIADKLNVEPEEVVPEANLVTNLKADSLDIVDLVMQLEEELGIEIEDSEAEKLTTVGKIHEFVLSKSLVEV